MKKTVGFVIVGVLTGLLFMDQAFAAKDFKLQGRLGIGASSTPANELEHEFEMRLGIETKRKKRVKAVVELRADEDGREATINDAFIDWRNKAKTSRIRGGRGKKILGWEFDYSTADRLSISRSLTYDFLSNRAIVGRDYFVGYQWTKFREVEEADEDEGNEGTIEEGRKGSTSDLDSSRGDPTHLIDSTDAWKLGIDFHYNESRDSAFIASATHSLSENLRLGAWAIFQWTRGQYRVSDSTGLMTSVLYQTGIHRAEFEIFYGDDPYRTQVEKMYGPGRNIRVTSVKGGYALNVGPINPYVVGTMFWKDLDHPGDSTREGIFGLRYYLNDDLSFAGECRITKNESSFDTTSEPYLSRIYALLGRYYF